MTYRKWSLAELVPTACPPEASRYLTDVGLPLRIPRVFAASSQAPESVEGHPGLYPIGRTEGGQPICLRASSGEIVALHVLPEGAEMRVNSSVEQFAKCLTLCDATIRHVDERGEDNFSPEEREKTLSWLLEGMRALDPAVIDDERSYWRVVLAAEFAGG